MKRLNGFKRLIPAWGIAVLVLVASVVPPAWTAQAASSKKPWGNLTPSQMTAVWWQWGLSLPVSSNPWYDATGDNATVGQPYFTAPGGNGQMFFLAGTFVSQEQANGDVLGEVTRAITIKQGTALFFPLLNTIYFDNVGAANRAGLIEVPRNGNYAAGVPVLRDGAKSNVDAAQGLYAMLKPTESDSETATGASSDLPIVRLTSQPFSFTLPAADNVVQSWGLNISGVCAPAVADGFWCSIPGGANGLVPGYYVLQFGGWNYINEARNTFTEIITYHITVTP